jgi:hypothetical protein
MSTETLHSPHFAECLHTVFQIQAPGGGAVPLELVKVTERHDAPHLEQFSLLFRGPLSPSLPQQIHEWSHESLGNRSMFFVPIGPLEGGMGYEVVFNRIRREGTPA